MSKAKELTPAERERLAILVEECAEVIHIGMKALRHGYESCHPRGGSTNREQLEAEIGDLRCAMEMMFHQEDVSRDEVAHAVMAKAESVIEYLHHQGPDLLRRLKSLACG